MVDLNRDVVPPSDKRCTLAHHLASGSSPRTSSGACRFGGGCLRHCAGPGAVRGTWSAGGVRWGPAPSGPALGTPASDSAGRGNRGREVVVGGGGFTIIILVTSYSGYFKAAVGTLYRQADRQTDRQTDRERARERAEQNRTKLNNQKTLIGHK